MPPFNALSTDNHRFAEQGSDPSTPDSGFVRFYFKSTGVYAMDDGGQIFPIFTYNQTGEIYIRASEMISPITAGAEPLIQSESTTNDVNLISMDFDQTNVEYAQFNVWIPDHWDEGNLSFKVVWTSDGGTPAETVDWSLQGIAYADSDAVDTAWGTGVTITDTLLAVGDIHYSPTGASLTIGNSPSTGELVQFRISRQTGSDNLAADARLLGVKIYYGITTIE